MLTNMGCRNSTDLWGTEYIVTLFVWTRVNARFLPIARQLADVGGNLSAEVLALEGTTARSHLSDQVTAGCVHCCRWSRLVGPQLRKAVQGCSVGCTFMTSTCGSFQSTSIITKHRR